MRSLRLAPSGQRFAPLHRFPASEPHLFTAAPLARLPWAARGGSSVSATAGVPLALAVVLLALAVLVAPERPADQEAICHRHNGEAACRVW